MDEQAKDKAWRKTIEDKLDNIYSELTDGEVRRGLFSQVKHHDDEIKKLNTIVEEHDEVYKDYKMVRKWSIKAVWVGTLALIGKILWWIIDAAKVGWKVGAMWLTSGGSNNT